jgi:hypothetical protein
MLLEANVWLEIKPFHLFFNRKESHMDPVHHLLRWIRELRQQSGPLFRNFDAYDRPILNGKGLVSYIDTFELVY